jgi:hypothetical protein
MSQVPENDPSTVTLSRARQNPAVPDQRPVSVERHLELPKKSRENCGHELPFVGNPLVHLEQYTNCKSETNLDLDHSLMLKLW